MPIYEYVCDADGEKIELLRPISKADEPVQDPKGKGREFRRVQSTFASKAGGGSAPGAGGAHVHSGSCGCGKPRGACGG